MTNLSTGFLSQLESGKRQPSTETLAQLSAALGLPVTSLIEDDGAGPRLPPDAAPPSGFREEATPYEPLPQSQTLSQSLNPASTAVAWPGRHPSITHRASIALPDFGILPGDLIVCDLSRDPEPGEVVVVAVVDQQLARSVTIIRRYAPPHLIGGSGAARADILTTDHPDLGHLHPMIGLIRGA